MPSISETPEKIRQPKLKQDHYTKVGATAEMHGKSRGGHPEIRGHEMKEGKGEGPSGRWQRN